MGNLIKYEQNAYRLTTNEFMLFISWHSKSMAMNVSNGVCNGKAMPGLNINLFYWSGLNECDLHLFSVYLN